MSKFECVFVGYEDNNLRRIIVEGNDDFNCICKIVEKLNVYLKLEDIEEYNMDFMDIIDNLCDSNGDGCDFIFRLRDLENEENYIEEDEECMFYEDEYYEI